MKEKNTRSYFESLSTSELISLAENYGIDMPQDLDRIFMIGELLECTETNDSKKNEDININTSDIEPAFLPKQYNVSFINIIIRDPLWVYAFWEVKEFDKEIHEKAPDFNGYFLRIIPLDEENKTIKSNEDSFTVPVDLTDNDRYICFTDHSSFPYDRYLIKLAAGRGETEYQIAASLPFCLPRLVSYNDIKELSNNPLIKLSGIKELPVIIDRNKEL